jgi:peroxiredoxin Q/BCP
LRDHFAEFQKQGVEILGVSFDTPKDNAAFASAEHFPFRLLSDGNRELAAAVGAADSSAQPLPRRISYLVGPDGKVLRVYAGVNPTTHAQEVLQDLPAH